jgi:hypothetical protein
VSNWFLENPEDDEQTETDQMMRDRHIQTRLRRAKRLETIDAMKARYKEYGYDI